MLIFDEHVVNVNSIFYFYENFCSCDMLRYVHKEKIGNT